MSGKINVLAYLLRMFFKGSVYNIIPLLSINPYPEFLVFYATFRCNSRCKACNIWQGDDVEKKKEELTLDQIDKIFSDRLFRKLKLVNIQGGEATLRDDLGEIVKIIIKRVPFIRCISLTSNGLDAERVMRQVEKIYEICSKRGVDFSIGLSIDGVGEYHDFARGKDAFKRVMKTIEKFNNYRGKPRFSRGTNCVLTAQNIYNLDEIIRFQREVFKMENLSIVEFREHFMNKRGSPEGKQLLFTENPKEKAMLISYLKKNNYPAKITDMRAYRYEQLRRMLEDNKPRTQSCQYKISGLVLDHRGNLMLCPVKGYLGSCLERSPSEVYFSKNTKRIRREMSDTVCKGCYPYNFYENERFKDFIKYIFFFVRSRLKKKYKERLVW